MPDTVRTIAELLVLFADSQPPHSTTRQLLRDTVLSLDADIATRLVNRNSKAEGCVGNGVSDDRAPLNTLVNTTMQPSGGVVDVIGVLRIGSNLSIPYNVRLNFQNQAYLAPDIGVTVTLHGTFNTHPEKKFGGAGIVTFGADKPKVRVRPEWWGAKIDGTTNDQPAYQAAMNAAVAMAPSVFYSPPGTAALRFTLRTTDPDTVNSGDGHALVIDGSNVTLMGDPNGTSKIKYLGFTGGNPATDYQVVNGKIWRGGGIFVRGGVTSGATRSNITIRDIELDGNAIYTGNNALPASIITGDGWDVTHKGIWFENDRYLDRLKLIDVHVHNFRGELVYAGGLGNIGRLTGRNLELHDTNGDAWSCSARTRLVDSELYNCAAHGIEDTVNQPSYYGRLEVHDCASAGIVLVSAGHAETDNLGPAIVENNVFTNCAKLGMAFYSARNLTARDNTIIDSGWDGAGSRGIVFDSLSYETPLKGQNISLLRNKVVVNTKTMPDFAVTFIDTNSKGYANVEVADNHVQVTALAVANGKTITNAYDFDTLLAAEPKAILRNNTAHGTTYCRTDLSSCQDKLLTTVDYTTLLQRRPFCNTKRLFEVLIAYRVVTATTTVFIQYSWDEATWVPIVNNVATAVGEYVLPAQVIQAKGDQSIKVYAQANVANRVYVTATIREVPVG